MGADTRRVHGDTQSNIETQERFTIVQICRGYNMDEQIVV